LNHSLRAAETLTAEPRPVLVGIARRTDDGVLARRDRTSPIDLLAARYPLTRRLVGAPSFRVAARRFILSDPPSAPIPPSYGDRFPRFVRTSGNGSLAHIYFLIGFRNRLAVATNWCWNYITFQRGARLITGISGSRIEDVMPAVVTAPTLVVNAGDSGLVLYPRRENAQHV
jgi:Putative DNA-binding domain